jgi:hypothetical protein
MAIVYQHRRNDTNEVFYIGIGKEQKRAFIKSSRSANSKVETRICRYYDADVGLIVMIDDLLKAAKAVTRKSRYYDTEARTGITKTDSVWLHK